MSSPAAAVLTLPCGCQYQGEDWLYMCAIHVPRPKIRTEYVCPPIPIRQFDWSAVTDDYEPGAPQGFGPTEAAAIKDLEDQLEDDLAPGQHLSLDDYLADEADDDSVDDPDPLEDL